jgi:hypothetical protein
MLMFVSKFGIAAPSHFEELGPDFLVPSAQLGVEPPELDVEDYDSDVEAGSDDDSSDHDDVDMSTPQGWHDDDSEGGGGPETDGSRPDVEMEGDWSD